MYRQILWIHYLCFSNTDYANSVDGFVHSCTVMDTSASHVDLHRRPPVHTLNRSDHVPQRRVRKAIFSHQLWFPKRHHALRPVRGSGSRRYSNDGGSNAEHDGLSVGLFNAQSVTRKSTAISDTVSDRRLDVLALTETRHLTNDDLPAHHLDTPSSTRLVTRRRPVAAAGVALLFTNRFIAKRLTFAAQPTTCEVLGCTSQSASLSAVYIVIYRPGSQVVSELFFEELTSLLETVATYRCRIIVRGDFNIHVNDRLDRHSQRLAAIIESFDLSQVVSGPTHRDGNTLDLVLTRRDCQPISCDVQPTGMMSDHSLVTIPICQLRRVMDS